MSVCRSKINIFEGPLTLLLFTCAIFPPVVARAQNADPAAGRLSGKTDHASQKDAVLVPLPRVTPAPEDNPTTPAKVALGKHLFFDPRLSGDNSLSCASCHLPEKAYGDGLALGVGTGGKQLVRNTPTCLNVGFLTNLFWDGRAGSLEEQALGPIQSADEMNQDLDQLEQELRAIPAYVSQFESVFGTEPDANGVAKALAAYQRTLLTEPSPFDRFLMGNKDALSEAAKQGLRLFQGDAGCIECHRGVLLSDNKFHRLGVSHRDPGRANVSGKREDRFRFRTPSLRNIAETGPYMHDGSLKTLDDVVTFYYRGVPDSGPGGLKPDIASLSSNSFSDIPALVTFLHALSGKLPDFTPPRLPAVIPGEPATAISPAVRANDGFLVHTIESPYQTGQTDLRVLLPDRLAAGKPCAVVYVLPVEQGRGVQYGDGLLEVRDRDLHNMYGVIFVAPTFATLPWYADHPTELKLRHESYLLNVVVPFVEQTYPVSRQAADRLLLGFSKSGWGAWTLLLRHPDTFGRAAAWDAPLMMESVGQYGNSELFGTQRNFESYRVADLLAAQSGKLRTRPRLILTGYGNFRQHHQQIHVRLNELGIPHAYRDGPHRKHDWHSGWVRESVELILAAD